MNDAFAQVIDPILRSVLTIRQDAEAGQHPPLEAVKADLLAPLARGSSK